jgi:hypothetical protein
MQRLFSLFTLGLIFTMLSCASSNDTNNQLSERMALFDEKAAIQEMVFNAECSDKSECKYIGFGSKPCGGPWFYMVYNSSIEEEVIARVEAYNKKEDEFNKKYGIVSDCSAVLPPDRIACKNGKCIPVYE